MNKLFTKPYILLLIVFLIGISAIISYNQYSAVAAPRSVKPPLEHEKLDANLNHLLKLHGGDGLPPQLLDDLLIKVPTEKNQPQSLLETDDIESDEPDLGPKIPVMFFLSNKRKTDNLVEFLEDNQSIVIFSDAKVGYIEAKVPVSVLPEASERSGVRNVEPIIPPDDEQVIGESVEVHGVDEWHNDLGTTGNGVKVAVLDSSFDGFTERLGTELPADTIVHCSYADDPTDIGPCGGGTHGTRVAESLIDIAPDVDLYVASTGGSPYKTRSQVEWLVSQGVQVINQSQGDYWNGAGDGDSSYESYGILDTINIAVAGGAVWVNSTGNYNKGSWYGNFTDSDNDGYHEWTNDNTSANGLDNNEKNAVNLTKGNCYSPDLRWEGVWGGETTDLDIILTNSSGVVISPAGNIQDGDDADRSYEYLSCPTIATTGKHYFSVKRQSGTAPAWVQLQSRDVDLKHITNSGGINGAAESSNPGMIAVGAAYWDKTEALAGYSSRGPAPDGRIKPDIVGATGVHLSQGFFGGTSQAAPHIAGLAALVIEQNPDLTPAEVVTYLKNSAIPRGSKVPNKNWGAGFGYLPNCDHACLP